MANQAVNNFKVRSAYINNTINNGRYSTEDLTKAEQMYLKKHAPKQRTRRTDLSRGNVVVVLEGAYMGRKAILLALAEECMALVACVKSNGGVSIFKIDERYLYKLRELSVTLPSNFEVDMSTVFVSGLRDTELMETEATPSEKSAEKILNGIFGETAFFRAYMKEDFKIDAGSEFYSLEY